jgi:hypothetical protein
VEIFTGRGLPVIKEEKGQSVTRKKMDIDHKEFKEENRKLRYLRFLVDFSILSIQQDDMLLEEAQELVKNVKRAACSLFPGKEETFELIYRPRFDRVIKERFGLSSEGRSRE